MKGWHFSEDGWFAKLFYIGGMSLPRSSCDMIWKLVKLLFWTVLLSAIAYFLLSAFFAGMFDVLLGHTFTARGIFFTAVVSLTAFGFLSYHVSKYMERRRWEAAKAFFTANPHLIPKGREWEWEDALKGSDWARKDVIGYWKEERKNIRASGAADTFIEKATDSMFTVITVVIDIWKTITGKVCIPIQWVSNKEDSNT